jgi:hypothetical protein
MLLGAPYWWITLPGLFQATFGVEIPDQVDSLLLPGSLVLSLAVTVLVIIDAVRRIRRRQTAALGFGSFLVKIVSVPFFVLNFVLVWFASTGLAFFGIGVLIAAVAIPATYITMLSTSIYSWAALIALRRDRKITLGLTIFYAAMLFLFVYDIAIGIVIFGHSRPSTPSQVRTMPPRSALSAPRPFQP